MKLSRQEAIKNIIATQHIETQTDLAEALRDAGFNVTQATVSRDIKDMMLIKVPDDNGRYKYGFPTDNGEILTRERLEDTLRRYILTINASENLIVIHTQPGTAQAVAYSLDHLNWGDLLGTVGGDDTVLLIVDGKENVEAVKRRLMLKKV